MTALKEFDISSCAITDHGVLHGAIDFYRECKKNNIKPILGLEGYCTESPDEATDKIRDNYHLVLLAKNETGWKNLIWLSNRAHLHNFYYKPRIWIEHLLTHSEGLIALSACLASFPAKKLRWESSVEKVYIDDYKKYIRMLKWFSEVFNGDYYLEIQDHDTWEQIAYNNLLVDIAQKENIPLVITSDAHYLKRQDFATHEMMMAMQLKKTLEEYKASNQMRYATTNYLRSSLDMSRSVRKYKAIGALENTLKIAEQCNLELTFGEFRLPTFDIKSSSDYDEFLRWNQFDKEKLNEAQSNS
jgi:DNA polymerase III subunit alpha